MKRELELRRRLRALETLGEAVGAMKSLSAHHFRAARGAVEPARTYREGVQRLFHQVGASLPVGDGPAALVVVGGELGLCGSYNARAVEAGKRRRQEIGPGPTFSVGRHVQTLLTRAGVPLRRSYEAPASVAGITRLLLPLAEDVLTTYAAEGLSSVDIVSSRFVGVGVFEPTSVRLLPFAPEPSEVRRHPRYVTADRLASTVAREFLYITLYDLLLDALASEHGARLIATHAAEQWLDRRTERLRRHLAATRREASTQEMIEIAAGARVGVP